MLALDELSTYSIVDFIPVDKEVLFRVFERQNESFWPYHGLAVALAVFILVRIWLQRFRFVLGSVGLAFIFVGVTFHLKLLHELVLASWYLGWAFVAQGLVMITYDCLHWQRWPHRPALNLYATAGISLMLFSFIFYPLLVGYGVRDWEGSDFFALTPDATAMFALGVMLVMPRSMFVLAIIPTAWCLLSGAVWYGVEWFPGLLLPVVGALTFTLIVAKFLTIAYGTLRGRA